MPNRTTYEQRLAMKPSERRAHYHQLRLESIRLEGHAAGMTGTPYADNPYAGRADPDSRKAWSEGHNNGRVQVILEKEERDG